MARAKKQPWRCLARDAETNRRCTRRVSKVQPGLHKGMCARHAREHPPTGPKTEEGKARSAANARRTHGLYAGSWTEEERDAIVDARGERYQLEAELEDTRVRRRRIIELIGRLDAGQPLFEDTEVQAEGSGGRAANGQPLPARKVTRRQTAPSRVELLTLLDRFTGRIAQLVRDIKELKLGGMEDDPLAAAREIRRAIQGMDELTGGEEGMPLPDSGEEDASP